MRTLELEIAGERVLMHGLKGMMLLEHNALVISDLHLGKATHFRKHGIAIPNEVALRDLFNLRTMVDELRPDRVIFLGDLFHSDLNAEWNEFGELLSGFPNIEWELVPGNHDIMDTKEYERLGIVFRPEFYDMGAFTLTHEPLENIDQDKYYLAGHIHPGIRLKGKGRRSMVVPCFHFGDKQGVMPSFGSFTGSIPIKPKKGDTLVAVSDEYLYLKQ